MAKSQSRRESAREPARHTPLHAARPPPAAPHAFRRAAAWHCTPLHAYCTARLAAPHIAPHMDPHMDPRMRATPYHSRRRHHTLPSPAFPLPGVAARWEGTPRVLTPPRALTPTLVHEMEGGARGIPTRPSGFRVADMALAPERAHVPHSQMPRLGTTAEDSSSPAGSLRKPLSGSRLDSGRQSEGPLQWGAKRAQP